MLALAGVLTVEYVHSIIPLRDLDSHLAARTADGWELHSSHFMDGNPKQLGDGATVLLIFQRAVQP